jgi:hypothetical protein
MQPSQYEQIATPAAAPEHGAATVEVAVAGLAQVPAPVTVPAGGLAGLPREIGGRDGPEPTRFGDWEKAGRCIDF